MLNSGQSGTDQRSLGRVLRWWRSPPDQPSWARPTLLAIASGAGLLYGWAMNQDVPEVYYGAAVRSMSESWKNFFYGAFDPAGTITVDKLPGELWVQSLFVRMFGFHVWTLAFPQMIEGILTVLVLYRAVRRIAGPVAGIVSATALAVSPAEVLLNRGNISDTLMILLLTLAADSASRAIATKERRSLVVAGIWVGLAFQAKMVEAWLIIPAIIVACAIGFRPAKGRFRFIAWFSVAAVAVSLAWMTVIAVIPAHDRPYVDASSNDSVYSQVFNYNGLERFGLTSLTSSLGGPVAPFIRSGSEQFTIAGLVAHPPAAANRLLQGSLGDNDAWFLPAAVVAGIFLALLGLRRIGPPTLWAGTALYGTWFLLFFIVFSIGRGSHTYYVAALAPPTAALCGLGVSALWERRTKIVQSSIAVIGITVSTLIYAVYLLPDRGPTFFLPSNVGVPGWTEPVLLIVGSLAVGLSFAALVFRRRKQTLVPTFVIAGMISIFAAPTLASFNIVNRGLGPFDYAFEPTYTSQVTVTTPRSEISSAELSASKAYARYAGPIMFATETSDLAAFPIYVTGREVLPIGGFLGAIPEPTLSQIESDIRGEQLPLVAVGLQPSSDPRIVWIRKHCQELDPRFYSCSSLDVGSSNIHNSH